MDAHKVIEAADTLTALSEEIRELDSQQPGVGGNLRLLALLLTATGHALANAGDDAKTTAIRDFAASFEAFLKNRAAR